MEPVLPYGVAVAFITQYYIANPNGIKPTTVRIQPDRELYSQRRFFKVSPNPKNYPTTQLCGHFRKKERQCLKTPAPGSKVLTTLHRRIPYFHQKTNRHKNKIHARES